MYYNLWIIILKHFYLNVLILFYLCTSRNGCHFAKINATYAQFIKNHIQSIDPHYNRSYYYIWLIFFVNDASICSIIIECLIIKIIKWKRKRDLNEMNTKNENGYFFKFCLKIYVIYQCSNSKKKRWNVEKNIWKNIIKNHNKNIMNETYLNPGKSVSNCTLVSWRTARLLSTTTAFNYKYQKILVNFLYLFSYCFSISYLWYQNYQISHYNVIL